MTTFVELDKANTALRAEQDKVATLLAHVADVCEDHVICTSCGVWCCETCGGDHPELFNARHLCDNPGEPLCEETCWVGCPPCVGEADDDLRAQRRSDARMERQ